MPSYNLSKIPSIEIEPPSLRPRLHGSGMARLASMSGPILEEPRKPQETPGNSDCNTRHGWKITRRSMTFPEKPPFRSGISLQLPCLIPSEVMTVILPSRPPDDNEIL